MTDAFHTRFTYRTAIPFEPGITRRDPSPVIEVDGTFHVWYSKATVDPSGYFASVWHATSADGLKWRERAVAIPTGADDAWDGNGVFTPTVLIAEGRYWLFYTAVPKPFANDDGGPHGTPTAIGVAVADDPHGPWVGHDGNPILRPGTEPRAPCDIHRVFVTSLPVAGEIHPGSANRVVKAVFPPEYSAWAAKNGYDPPPAIRTELPETDISIVSPLSGSRLIIDPETPRNMQTLPLRVEVTPSIPSIVWFIDGEPYGQSEYPYEVRWPLLEGTHTFQAKFSRANIFSEKVYVTVSTYQ